MRPFIPIYKRKPNTFIKYKEVDKGDYVERIAEYKNKNGELCEMSAQIIWKNHNHKLKGAALSRPF